MQKRRREYLDKTVAKRKDHLKVFIKTNQNRNCLEDYGYDVLECDGSAIMVRSNMFANGRFSYFV